MPRLEQLFFIRYGKPASGWYDFDVHRFIEAPKLPEGVTFKTFLRKGKPSGSYVSVDTGRFVEKPKEVIEFEKPIEPPEVKWVKVTVFYEGVAGTNSFHIDCGAVDSAYSFEVDEKIQALKRRIRKRVRDALGWRDDWESVEMSLGLRVGVAVEDDGTKEEWCEVWRV